MPRGQRRCRDRSAAAAAADGQAIVAVAVAATATAVHNRNRNRNRNRGAVAVASGGEDRVEMLTATALDLGVRRGVATVFDETATVELSKKKPRSSLRSRVTTSLGRLIGGSPRCRRSKSPHVLPCTAAAGRRPRIQVDVDGYRARRKEALARFTQIAERKY